MIATDAFAGLAHEAAESQGLAEARIVTIAHPIGGVAEAELEARAALAVDAALAAFTGA